MPDDKPLADEPFDYQIAKDGKVLMYWQNRLVKTIAGAQAQKFIAQVQGLDEPDVQHLLARYTGNFKRGNERDGKNNVK